MTCAARSCRTARFAATPGWCASPSRPTAPTSASAAPTARNERPPVPLLALGIFIVLAFIALIPFSLVQRFRRGTMRRRAMRWVIGLNFGGTFLSVLLFIAGAAITTRWVPGTLTYTAAGLALGC